MTTRLSTPLQLDHMKHWFTENNPFTDPQLIDWSIIDETLTFNENLECMENNYPSCLWRKQDDYDLYYVESIKKQASEAGYTLVRDHTYKAMENKAHQYDSQRQGKQIHLVNGADTVKSVQVVKDTADKQLKKIVFNDAPLDKILDDAELKPLVVAGEPGNGKTTIVKQLTMMAKKRGWIVQCFDISTAWYHDSPLSNRVTCYDWGSPPNIGDTMYDMSALSTMDRRTLVSRMIKENWDTRLDGVKDDPEYLGSQPMHLYIFEEGNTYFSSSDLNKKDWCGQTLTDFISVRRNLKFTAIIVATAVSGEIATRFRRRCSYMLSRVTSQEERNYLRKSTDDETMKVTMSLPRYKFVFYGREHRILAPFGVEYRRYKAPVEVQRWIPESESVTVKGFMEKMWDALSHRKG